LGINDSHQIGAIMDIQNIVNNGVAQFVASLTQNLKPNEASAIGQIVLGIVALIEAQAMNNGGPVLLSELARQYPPLAAVVSQIPELKALVSL
jgi:hypothetical protein